MKPARLIRLMITPIIRPMKPYKTAETFIADTGSTLRIDCIFSLQKPSGAHAIRKTQEFTLSLWNSNHFQINCRFRRLARRNRLRARLDGPHRGRVEYGTHVCCLDGDYLV